MLSTTPHAPRVWNGHTPQAKGAGRRAQGAQLVISTDYDMPTVGLLLPRAGAGIEPDLGSGSAVMMQQRPGRTV